MLIELISILCVSGSDRTGYSCKDRSIYSCIAIRITVCKTDSTVNIYARPGEARGTAVSSVRVRGA